MVLCYIYISVLYYISMCACVRVCVCICISVCVCLWVYECDCMRCYVGMCIFELVYDSVRRTVLYVVYILRRTVYTRTLYVVYCTYISEYVCA